LVVVHWVHLLSHVHYRAIMQNKDLFDNWDDQIVHLIEVFLLFRTEISICEG
jgi:hypothetical protein